MKTSVPPSAGKAAGQRRRVVARRAAFAACAALTAALLVGAAFVTAQSPVVPVVATVRHAPTLGGRIEGSVQVLTGEYLTLNSGNVVKGDLLVPGTPAVVRNGTPVFQGTIDGSGSTQPSNYSVTLNSGSEVRYVRRRVDPVTLAPVPVPPAPTGTRYVTINSPGQSIGDWATVRNLTLNSNVGSYAVPAGTYGSFTANGGGSFVLGMAGATQVSVYNFEDITLNSLANLNVVGPVVVNVANRVSVNSSCVVGSATNPRWLGLNISRYDLTVNGGQVYAVVRAPAGSVTLSAATLKGEVASDRLTVNGGTIVGVPSDTTPPTLSVTQPADGAFVNTTSVNVAGTFGDESATSVKVNGVAAAVSGNSFSVSVPLAEGANTLTVVATDAAGNSTTATRSVTRDTVAPALALQQPAEGSVTNAPAVTVNGTYSDQSATTVTVNGAAPTVSGGGFSADVTLSEGPNTIKVVATDAAGNRSEVVRTVNRDTVAPALSVTSPQDFSYTSANEVHLSGSFGDAVSVTVNGAAPTVSGNNFSAPVPLTAEGANTIAVTALDAAGNRSELFHTVYRDTSAPTLSLISPGENETLRLLLVQGSVADASPVTVTIDGAQQTAEDGSFEYREEVAEGARQIKVIATDAAGNRSELTRSVTIDKTAPTFSDISPPEGTAANSPATVSGRVTDASAVTVKVNDVAASVGAGGTFTAENISLAEGENQLLLTAVDAAGNQNDLTLTLVGPDRTPPAAPVLFPVTSPTRLTTSTLEGRAEPGALVVISGGAEPVTTNAAFDSGLFTANVTLAVGANDCSVVARDAAGNASPAAQVSVASNPQMELPPAGEASQINISTGNSQRGLVSATLPRPLIAFVTDRAGNPVANVPVKFTAQVGGGQFTEGGGNSVDVNTDAQGYARAAYVSGPAAGLQQISANFSGNTVSPAVFLAEALTPEGTETKVSGSVLDQNLRALPNVLVRIGGQQTRTGADGRFTVGNVAAGPHQLLELIGRDQIALPGRWPNITYDFDVLPGVDNELGRPLFLPKVNPGVAMPLDADNVVTRDTVYELPAVGGLPPVRVTAKAGTHVIFPPDVTDKRLSVTRIAANRIPMSLDDGRATNLYISVQPSGAVFETPLEISFPNLDGAPANSEVLLMSFDHDAGRYVKVGTGHVTSDGREVRSDPGEGIHVGAWHALPPPKPKPVVTVLGQIQIAGNPALEGKTITRLEAWVDGVPGTASPDPAHQPLDDSVSFVNLKFTLVMPDDNPRATLINSTMVAEKKLKIKFDSADSRFAPSVERFNFKYTITSPDTAPATYAKLEIFKAGDPNPIYLDEALPVTANKLDYTQGGTSGWDGKMNQGAGSGKYIEPKDGPFTARLSVATQPDKSDLVQSEDKTIKVEIDSMDMTPQGDFKSFKANRGDIEKDNEVTLTVKVKNKSGNGVVTSLPFHIRWSFEDPDDTAGNNVIDPNGGAGGDNIERRFGGKAADTGGPMAPALAMWKSINNFPSVVAGDGQTAESDVVTAAGPDQGTTKITFSTSTIGGDNYYLLAKYLKDDGVTLVKDKKSGKWSVWKQLNFQNAYRMNGGADIDTYTARDNVNPAFNGDGYTDYHRARVVGLANGAQSPRYISALSPPLPAELPAAGDPQAVIDAKAQAWFNRNNAQLGADLNAMIATIGAPPFSIIGARYYHEKLDGDPGTGATNYYPPATRINASNTNVPNMVDPDGEWRSVQAVTTANEITFIFLNVANIQRYVIVARHEIGHASDHVTFGLGDGGNGDHAASALMHQDSDQLAMPPDGNPNFSPISIRRLRGIRP